MSLFKNYFNSEKITDITYGDVVRFFKEAKDETDKIEYKSFAENERENQTEREKKILQSVCGFLNSDGGIIIWGAPKGKKVPDKKEKVFQGELDMVEYPYEKDAFINKVTDSLTPTPRAILFHRIDKAKKHIYILEIPKSEYSPHQFQHRYYMRIDGQTRPAPHHYVEALMRKVRFPNLEGYISMGTYQFFNDNFHNTVFQLYVNVFIFNLSKLQNDYNVSYRLLCTYGKFQGWNSTFRDPGVGFGEQGRERRVDNIKEVIHYGEPVNDYVTIEFDPYELQRNNNELELFLHFGAKHSPMKTSWYRIKVNPPSPSAKIQESIIARKENQYMHEVKEELGITDRQSILKILGREE